MGLVQASENGQTTRLVFCLTPPMAVTCRFRFQLTNPYDQGHKMRGIQTLAPWSLAAFLIEPQHGSAVVAMVQMPCSACTTHSNNNKRVTLMTPMQIKELTESINNAAVFYTFT